MMLSFVLPVLAVTASNPMPDYPAQKVLDAFATACSGIEDMAVAQASVKAAGWEEYVPSDDDPLGKLIAIGKQIMAVDDELVHVDGGAFHKTVAGRDLHLVLSGATVDTVSSFGCRIYDFAATEPLSIEIAKDWAVRDPTDSSIPFKGATKYVWNPGMKPGHMEMEISFVEQDAEVPGNFPVRGLVLTAQVLEIEGL